MPPDVPKSRLGYPVNRLLGPVQVAAALVALGVLCTGCGTSRASSPSGVQLAYAVDPEEAPLHAGIYVVDRGGGHRARLTRPTAPDASDVFWSPTSDLLLFESLSGDVWTVRADGTDLRRIAAGGASWSPNGTMIAVGSRSGVRIFTAGGRLQTTIVRRGAPGYIGTPSWSPDSRRVAFDVASRGNTGTSAIFVAPVDGSRQAVPLLDPRTHHVEDRSPYWSPDGTLLAFEVEGPTSGPSVWRSRADGSARRLVEDDAFVSGWVPDGDAVVCTGAYKDAPREACPVSGAPPRPLTANERRTLYASSYSPDGRRSVGVNLGGAVVVTEADGASRVVTDPATDSLPKWSRDGRRLTFVRDVTDARQPDAQAWVYVVGLDGAPPRRLVPGLFDRSAEWLPGDARIVLATSSGTKVATVSLDGRVRPLADGELWALSPDGKRIAYARKDPATSSVAVYIKSTQGGAERKIFVVPASDNGSASEVDDLIWSADGQSLFAVWPPDAPFLDYLTFGSLHEITLSGRTRLIAGRMAPREGISVSPDGTEIAFTSRRGLEIVGLDTGRRRVVVRATTLTKGPESGPTAELPQWSPDGSRIAYLTNRLGGTEMWLESVSPDGSDIRRVSLPGEVVYSYAWRPAAENPSK